MIQVIAAKEFLELRRDRRFVVAALILSLALLVGGAFGAANFLDLRRQAEAAGHNERQRWLDQGDKHPHGAAHYGVFAFKSPRPLAMIDTGLQPYVGSLVWLEAHKQNEMLYRPAEDATALQRFGDLTPAIVAQTLIPLLIVFLAYGSFSRERELGTLAQLTSLGVRSSDLLLGKAAGAAGALSPILLPAFVFSLAVIAAVTPSALLWDELARFLILALIYSAYFAIFIFVALAVSAWRRSSAAALAILLVFWALTTLVAPRVLSDWARAAYPTDPAIELKQALESSLAAVEARSREDARKDLVEKYGVAKVEDLPFAFEGAALQAEEESAYGVFERHYAEFFDVLRWQNLFYQFGALLSPLTAVQLSSMALAGNDLEQHRDFVLQAEANRRVIHTMINDYILKHGVRDADGQWGASAGRELWQEIPPFDYRPNAWSAALAEYGAGLGLLGLWLLCALAAAFRAAASIKAV
ncbi:ABC transporter permease subunit [Methylocapsa palsarum]|uniref:ABC-2 type transport system permease protein n=1 Tax=Methylocapsa palsarum TaxID=1612308 RepID=A0A1I4ANV2_9HYPH|nr:ABC transporter permease subunit [Methylocapsa palsarum]SFK58188.1 ABC-2 type transport system permease protein [Methylocapsa palsarum]